MASGSDNEKQDSSSEYSNGQGNFDCNICLDMAREAVVSLCGHLFCWSCLHQWLETRPNRQECPVCKAGISRDKVVPLYGRGNANQQDPRLKIPPRPRAQRSEAEDNTGMFGISLGDRNLQMSFGIGAFPFSVFGQIFSVRDVRPPAPQPGSADYHEEKILNRVFIIVAVIFCFWLLIA